MHNCAAVMHPNQLEWLIRSVTVTMTSNYRNICPSSWQLMQSWAFDRRTRKPLHQCVISVYRSRRKRAWGKREGAARARMVQRTMAGASQHSVRKGFAKRSTSGGVTWRGLLQALPVEAQVLLAGD